MKLSPEERAKTGCLGILIPIVVTAYSLRYFITRRSSGRFGATPVEGDAAIGLGVSAVGIAVFVHALGFVPYERILPLKWALVIAGIILFVLGIIWEHL